MEACARDGQSQEATQLTEQFESEFVRARSALQAAASRS